MNWHDTILKAKKKKRCSSYHQVAQFNIIRSTISEWMQREGFTSPRAPATPLARRCIGYKWLYKRGGWHCYRKKVCWLASFIKVWYLAVFGIILPPARWLLESRVTIKLRARNKMIPWFWYLPVPKIMLCADRSCIGAEVVSPIYWVM